jgi:tRNA1Val (adenine37-N6)-methyltransferase
MKVGTDGVLTGTWATCSNVTTILDTGTGSGLIALILAQRSPAKIDAIDIDENACKQAQVNFKNSPFGNRLQVYFSSLQDFSPERKYDLIVSNPPYFSNSLPSPDKGRTLSRHNNTLPFEDMIKKSRSLLSSEGKLAFIVPFDAFNNIHPIAAESRLFLSRKTVVFPLRNRPPKRILLEYSTTYSPIEENELFIEQSHSVYSKEYIALTKDFYLKM